MSDFVTTTYESMQGLDLCQTLDNLVHSGLMAESTAKTLKEHENYMIATDEAKNPDGDLTSFEEPIFVGPYIYPIYFSDGTANVIWSNAKKDVVNHAYQDCLDIQELDSIRGRDSEPIAEMVVSKLQQYGHEAGFVPVEDEFTYEGE